jgi:hypothetical protein
MIPTYILLAIFSLDHIIIQINAVLIELLLWGTLFIGLRDYASSHLFIYFENNHIYIKEGYITGKFLGYSSYSIDEIHTELITIFKYLEVIKLKVEGRTIRINSLMFSNKEFKEIKDKLEV